MTSSSGHITRTCDICKEKYQADMRNIKRGWGLCCSKSCAAKKREMSRPNYDPKRVERNNALRAVYKAKAEEREECTEYYAGCEFGYDDPSDSEYWDSKDY